MSIASSRFEDPEPSIIGYFQYTWGSPGVIPECNNTAIAFSGWADPATALSLSSNTSLVGAKYISLGGGYGSDGTPNAGKFTQTVLNAILTAINNGNFSNYKGILFDVEYIDTTGLTSQSAMYPLFQSIFTAAKSKSLKVIVCVGHSGNITDVAGGSQYTQLMTDFLSDANVDYVSPQLYANGNENPPQYNANGLPWSDWAASGKPIIFAIPWAQQYECVEAWAKQQFNPNQLSGFLQWNNTTYSGGTSCSGGGGGNGSVIINLTNSTSWTLTFNGTTTAPGGTYKTTLNIPFTNTTVFNSTPIVNSGDIACSTSEIDINFGYGNNGILTNIIASGTFNGNPFTVGTNPNIGNPNSTTNTLNITYNNNP